MTNIFRKYQDFNFREDTLEIIKTSNQIIEDYQRRGYDLTLRQLYYQFIGRDLMPNTEASYNRLGKIINNGRLAGLVSWSAITDRTRSLRGLKTFAHPNQAILEAHDAYRRDLWADQQWRPEVWVEKEALSGVIGQACNKLRVSFFACKGYNSQSEQWRAGQRFANYVTKGQRPIVFHLGDHDPSGLDMTRDNRERLEIFSGVPVIIQRLALNYDQIEELKPPPNPAKSTDSRFEAYRKKFGDHSWELDALDIDYIAKLIESNVKIVRDESIWDQSLLQEMDEKTHMLDVANLLDDEA